LDDQQLTTTEDLKSLALLLEQESQSKSFIDKLRIQKESNNISARMRNLQKEQMEINIESNSNDKRTNQLKFSDDEDKDQNNK